MSSSQSKFAHYIDAGSIGNGSFGSIKLFIDKIHNGPPIAAKLFHSNDELNVAQMFRKEAGISRTASEKGHANIIQYLGSEESPIDGICRIFYEFADSGDLIDLIEPEAGMMPSLALFYFKQLIMGVRHLHGIGIAHRDLKPDNMLLTNQHRILKLTDFGFATIFQSKGRERLLDTVCGTDQYLAPEVVNGMYRGGVADLWSCGVVLGVMLSGELLWERPSSTCERYQSWICGEIHANPWKKMDMQAIDLLRRILSPDMSSRATVYDIMDHPWYKQETNDSLLPAKRRKVAGNYSTSSQPEPLGISATVMNSVACSQPTVVHAIGSDLPSQDNNHEVALPFRGTRFMILQGITEAKTKLLDVSEALEFTSKEMAAHQILVKKYDLSFVVTFYGLTSSTKERVLVDFRRARGDGMEFKRSFTLFKKEISESIDVAEQLLDMQL